MRHWSKIFLLLIPFFSFISSTKISRDTYITNIKTKNANQEPLVAHVLVPLCDNENQGIVPVPSKLGNGLDPRNNLYWGALYGIKTHFKRSSKWSLIHKLKPKNQNILERCVFVSKNSGGNKVYLIADAYRGDKMKECLTDYFCELAGEQELTLPDSLNISTPTDLVIFNGHNGLMDTDVDSVKWKKSSKKKETIAIGCISYDYFEGYSTQLNTYPLLSTNHLMAPEAYVLEGALNSWMEVHSKEKIHTDVANAYNKYQKYGFKGAKNIFHVGWK